MKQETKFNYGFTSVSLAIPIIADYFIGRKYGVVIAIVVGVVGVLFLVSGHTHREEGSNTPMSRRRRIAASIVVGACLALAIMGIRAVFARETGQSQASTQPTAQTPAKAATQDESAPVKATPPKQQPKSTGQSATATSKGDNSPTGAINQQGHGNTAIVGNNNTVGSSADEIADKVAQKLYPTVSGGFHEVPDKIVFALGSVTMENSFDMSQKIGILHPISVGSSTPVEIRIVGDKILWSFKSWNDGLPIEVKDNEVKIGNEHVQRNFSANAFEVVNNNGEPLFQMIRKNAASIQVNGIFPTGRISQSTGKEILLWVSDETGVLWKSSKPSEWNLKPIFKYPAWKYPGVFADN